MLLPPGWVQIRLNRSTPSAVRALVERQTQNVPQPAAGSLRQELRSTFMRQVRTARESGGQDLFLLVDPVQGMPVDASCVAAVLPAPDAGIRVSPGEMTGLVGTADAPASTVSLTNGLAARRKLLREPTDDRLSLQRPTHVVQYFLPVPDSGRYLQLSYATSTPELLEPLEAVFEAMAGSVRFR